jgi:phenylacetaldehyde dehydrogenase
MTTVQAVLDEIRDQPGTGDVIPVFDPSTEEQIAEFTDCGPDAVNAAVARAKASAESGIWSQKPDYERAKILWRVAELIDKNAQLLAELEMLNGGMYPAQAEMQVKIGAEWFRYYAGWCTKISRGTVRSSTSAPSSRHRSRPAATASSNPLRRHRFQHTC